MGSSVRSGVGPLRILLLSNLWNRGIANPCSLIIKTARLQGSGSDVGDRTAGLSLRQPIEVLLCGLFVKSADGLAAPRLIQEELVNLAPNAYRAETFPFQD